MVNRIGCVKASHTPTRKCNKSTLNGNSLTEAQSQSKNTCETLHGTNHRHRDRRAGRCSGRCCPETQLTEVSPLGTAMKHSTRLKRTQNGACGFPHHSPLGQQTSEDGLGGALRITWVSQCQKHFQQHSQLPLSLFTCTDGAEAVAGATSGATTNRGGTTLYCAFFTPPTSDFKESVSPKNVPDEQ